MLAPAGTGQRILSVAAHSPGEAVASPARVLGDGSLKFKCVGGGRRTHADSGGFVEPAFGALFPHLPSTAMWS